MRGKVSLCEVEHCIDPIELNEHEVTKNGQTCKEWTTTDIVAIFIMIWKISGSAGCRIAVRDNEGKCF